MTSLKMLVELEQCCQPSNFAITVEYKTGPTTLQA